MKINTLKLSISALLAYAMCFTVFLSHVHAKDAFQLLRHTTTSNTSAVDSLSSGELRSKTISDLHHHIDKTTLKNVTSEPTTAARQRELDPLVSELEDETIGERFHDFLLRVRVVGSLLMHQFAYGYA